MKENVPRAGILEPKIRAGLPKYEAHHSSKYGVR
jgi:hypothetical protein